MNLFNFVLHAVDGGVPHEMVHNVAREVDCINFLFAAKRYWSASHAAKCGNKYLPNVAW